jgi:predicted amidohydrolase YtcJ
LAWASSSRSRASALTNLVEAGKTDPARLLRTKVQYTIVDGRIVYSAR